jgi:ubiquinone/menaquinone biosynthesis C-methylase UbiE
MSRNGARCVPRRIQCATTVLPQRRGFDVAGEYLRPGSRILDVGCRDAAHLIRLVQTHAAEGVGFDPIDWHLERAKVAVREAGLERRIEIAKAIIEEIEQPAESFDVVWCRDMPELVEGLQQGLAEVARVLKPADRVLVYTSFVKDLLEPKEAAMINALRVACRSHSEHATHIT